MISGVRLLLRSYLLSLGLVVAAFILRQVIAPLVGGYAIWVAFILAVHVIVARIVAETGLPFIRVISNIPQVMTNFSPSIMTALTVASSRQSSSAAEIALHIVRVSA